MIYKRCPRCGKRIEVGTKCCCKSKRYKEEDKAKKGTREKNFYSSAVWRKKRAEVIRRFHGLDVYSYYVYKRIEYGRTVHHIIPLKEDWNNRLNINNMIYLTERNHQDIHNIMEQGIEEKQKIINLLRKIIDEFVAEFY